ncbi:hypothetical protein [Porphyromonas sp.]
MTTLDIWLIARLAALRSSYAPATTAGEVPIVSSQSRMTATVSLSIATAPSGELTMATYSDGTKE